MTKPMENPTVHCRRPNLWWLRPLKGSQKKRPSFIADANDCWIWQGRLNNGGYPQTKVGRSHRRAHRVFYEHFVGPIPDGLTLDHLCRNRACVNPLHLEPVTMRENTMRGTSPSAKMAARTHCKHGHNNWGVREGPNPNHRRCLTCRKQRRVVARRVLTEAK